jgi:anaerobic selenocysteine-containing dehydrogenase
MDRRNFIKISALTGAAAALDACGKPDHQLIRFVPEENLVPGIATWKPSICTMCPAGCGVLVRVMQGNAEVVRKGQLGMIEMGLAKKLEGNPHHPISQGKLCPRGQAGLQATYHPDRVKNPLKRSGPRGSGQFEEISWDEAIQELTSHLAALVSAKDAASLTFASKPLRGQRRVLIERFLAALGAPPAIFFEPFEDAVLRRANWLSFGRYQLPTVDLGRSNYVISFGADFLGTWNSPVAQNVAYGEMRQGRPGIRAKFVQVEARMSQTGANADEWLPAQPGTEGMLALGLAHVMLKEKLRPVAAGGRAATHIEGWSEGLADYAPEKIEKRTGVSAKSIIRLARELAANSPAVAIIGGASLAHTNGLFSALAINALNELLGSIEKPGGISFTPAPPLEASKPAPPDAGFPGAGSVRALADRISKGESPVRALLLYETNPVFATPAAWRFREVMEKIPFIASFGSFLDETSSLADLILPDHSFLESWLDDVPESGGTQSVVSLAAPAVRPLHNTRAMPDVLLEVAQHLGGRLAATLPWRSYDEMLRAAVEPLRKQPGSLPTGDADEFWKKLQGQGGWWSKEAGPPAAASAARAPAGPVKFVEPQFDGAAQDFPFHFFPYPSQQFLDGSLAHLPWLQEMPDVLSTAMWGTWVEINPKTAQALNIHEGDLVEVTSQHGAIRAPALFSPGIAPDVIAMPAGQGHEAFGRYASHRGANPFRILAPVTEPETQSLAWAATRVKISRVGEGKLILFAGGMRERPHETEHR